MHKNEEADVGKDKTETIIDPSSSQRNQSQNITLKKQETVQDDYFNLTCEQRKEYSRNEELLHMIDTNHHYLTHPSQKIYTDV